MRKRITIVAGSVAFVIAAVFTGYLALDRKKLERTILKGDPIPFSAEVKLLSRTENSGVASEPPVGRIVEIDRKAGEYAIEWVGRDSEIKRVAYFRPDTVQAAVHARVSAGDVRKYKYTYNLRNSSNSGTFLSGFVLQTLGSESVPIVKDGAYVGIMGSHIPEFSEGTWYRFGNDTFGESVQPGSQATVQIESDHPPAIVQCKIHSGPMRLKGAGEDMPQELEDRLPGYESWPTGFTIGPSDNQMLDTLDGKIKYLVDNLDRMSELGWIDAQLVPEFQRAIEVDSVDSSDLEQLILRELENGRVAEELLAILYSRDTSK